MRTTDTTHRVDETSSPTAARALERVRVLCHPTLRAAVASLEPPLRHIAEYHFGWADAEGVPAQGNGGKAVRPALTVLSAEAAGGRASHAVTGAVAVELVHNFSLLHDDVIDGDPTRRHRPTVWAVYGRPTAILTGDALLSLAFQTLSGAGYGAAGLPVLAAAATRLTDGQLRDLDFESRVDVSMADCLDLASRKTGALMAAACRLGALSAGADGHRAELFARFGLEVGLAFQHADDLLGIWGAPEVTGKPVGSDLFNRKRSLPVVAALTAPGPAAARLRDWYARDGEPTAAELAEATALVERAGGRDRALAESARALDAALAALDQAAPAGPAADRLRALARRLAFRDS